MSLSSGKTLLLYNLASADSDRKGLPFIEAARSLGFKTIVTTHSADTRMLCGDLNEVVPLENLKRLHELVAEHHVDFTMTVNSRLTPLVAEVNRKCRIPSFTKDAAVILNNKDRCAEFITQAGFRAPRHWIARAESDWELLPSDLEVILKPSFSTGAVDTLRFKTPQALREKLQTEGLWCQSLNQQIGLNDFYRINDQGEYFGRFLIQEYIPYKKQIGMELLVCQGKLHLVHSAQILTAAPDFISAYAHVGPVEIPDSIFQSFQKLVNLLQIKNCHLTPDFLIDSKDNWYLIDANLNLGGEGLIQAIQARGLNYPLESLKAFWGLDYNLSTNALFSASHAFPSFDGAKDFKVSTAPSFEALKTILGRDFDRG